MFVYSALNLMLENRMSYYCKNRLKNIGPATAGSVGPVPAPLGVCVCMFVISLAQTKASGSHIYTLITLSPLHQVLARAYVGSVELRAHSNSLLLTLITFFRFLESPIIFIC